MAMIRLNQSGQSKDREPTTKCDITWRVKEKESERARERERERERNRREKKKRRDWEKEKKLVAFHLQLAAFQLAHAICVREVVMGGAKAEAMAGNSSINTSNLPISMGPP